MKENLTEVVFIIDRSTSMRGLEEETISGYNQFLLKQKEVTGEAVVSTVLFDTEFEVLHDRIDIKKVNLITAEEYYVQGCTALYDTIGRSINHIGNVLHLTKEENRPKKVIFVIITDGMENSSKEFSHHIIKDMIEHQKTKYNWEFLFLGANFDAESFAESISISRDRAVRYQYSKEGIETNYSAVSDAIYEMRLTDEAIDDSWKEKIKKEEI